MPEDMQFESAASDAPASRVSRRDVAASWPGRQSLRETGAVRSEGMFATLCSVIVCPLCQNEQAEGIECDVCGRPFPEHLVEDAGHEDMPVEPMPGLETTRVAEPKAEATPPSEQPACNWCGHKQRSGRVCERCGMQRHRGRVPEPKVAVNDDGEPLGHCGECGFDSRPPRCVNCGSVIDMPD